MVYISIESRKGGVGKTTVSLSLAELLLQNGFQVLLFDMDFIGTRVDATFLKANNYLIHEVSMNDQPVNLLSLFKDWFVAGKGIPAFSQAGAAAASTLTLEEGKVNLLGSNIYGGEKALTPIEDPRILYDAFHAYWMLEFTKKLSKAFCMANGSSDNVAVLFDNSPGFSSIENGINDYLTELGPDNGKVLLVSSVDPQDIEACRQSKASIETLLNEKIAAGIYYRALLKEGKGEKKDTPAFKAVWNSLCASNGKEPTFFTKDPEAIPPFVTILANKVPRNITEQLYVKGVLVKDEMVAPFLNHLLYYFSNPLLETQKIQHQLNFKGGINEFLLSGHPLHIEEDEQRYKALRAHVKQIGLSDFFKEEWSPMAPFTDLLENLRSREALKGEPAKTLTEVYSRMQGQLERVSKEVSVVEQFVQANLNDESSLKPYLKFVRGFVDSELKNVGLETDLNLHSDIPKLQEVEDFTTYFGLAAYRLKSYEPYCKLLNELIVQSLGDVEKMETLDHEAISNVVENVIEGRKTGEGMKLLSQLFMGHKNARELAAALNQTLKVWGVVK